MRGCSFCQLGVFKHADMRGHSAVFCVSSLCSLLVCVCWWEVAAYKHVLLLHGLRDGPQQFDDLITYISETHPGTNVTALDLYDGEKSLEPLWEQVEGYRKAIYPIMESAKDGVHLICYSQGGMICRGLLATLPDHNVHSAIFLSAPLAGQYGGQYRFFRLAKLLVSMFCYTALGQRVSVCNYWNDPHHRKLYLKGNSYLALLNGEKTHPNISEWKENFLRIKKLVLIGGEDDGLITPWKSSFFGFYDEQENVVEMRSQNWYLHDVFGLKTLDMRKDLVQCQFSGIEHIRWPHVREVYDSCIEKWL
uniref:palmitoyl-CoA hydrolase n=1 Tax=Denticeps clupeoides TaxID=299321 RepID=A0AAY4E7G6_9TELE